MRKFLDAVDPYVAAAMLSCMPGISGRKKDIRYNVVFIVSAQGKIERILHPQKYTSPCFAEKFRVLKPLPRPPKDHWPVVVNVAYGP